ncbi:MAG: response regulator transcription factor [Saprospiraceae bacterium]|nr:response regulator transcription factor [Saprospiraceae bacterium]MBP6566561.1 response regulator transcription factor [Saprospiraceae bacterium]
MTTIIIEDEKPAARMLQRKLEKLNIPVQVMLHSVREAIEWFQQNPHPDLIFLDIQLSDGLSFEIFEKVSIQSPIIFTTAYDEYALRAFKLNSIDYLLKPIDEDDLEVAVEKYRKTISPKPAIDMQMIRQLFTSSQAPEYKKRFSVKVGDHIKIIPIEEVELFYSEYKGTFIHTFEGRTFLLDTTLESLEKELDPTQFFRISRKYIIGHTALKDIVVYSNSRLKLTLKSYNKEEVIVSRERVGVFKEWLG